MGDQWKGKEKEKKGKQGDEGGVMSPCLDVKVREGSS